MRQITFIFRIIIVFIICFLCFTCFTIAGDNANAYMSFDFYTSFPTIAGDNGHATLGGIGANQTVYLKIYAHNVKDLNRWEFRFRYDTNYVRQVQVKTDSDFVYQISVEKNILNKNNSFSLWVIGGGELTPPNEVVIGALYTEKADTSKAPDGSGLLCLLAFKTTSRFSLATETKFEFYRWHFGCIRDSAGGGDTKTSNLPPGYLKGNTTDIKEDETVVSIPTTLALLQNFPNPFNPTTTIPFQIPKGVNVTLSVYNILGQEVVVLVNKYLPQGSYQIPFHIGTLPSGVYFYRLKAGSFVQTRQMLILK